MKHEISKSLANTLSFLHHMSTNCHKISQIILKSRNLTAYQLANTAFLISLGFLASRLNWQQMFQKSKSYPTNRKHEYRFWGSNTKIFKNTSAPLTSNWFQELVHHSEKCWSQNTLLTYNIKFEAPYTTQKVQAHKIVCSTELFAAAALRIFRQEEQTSEHTHN